MLDQLRDRLFLWRPRCAGCNHRRPLFLTAMCFACEMDEMRARTWRRLAQALEQLPKDAA